MLRRVPFKRKPPQHEPSVTERDRHPIALKPIERSVSFEGTTRAVPKTTPKRNRVLLEMANGRPCLLCPPGRCACPLGSVVACHSNLAIHGKAGARKADDCYSVWGGSFIHAWLDQGGATAAVKERVFMAGHLRQVNEWRRIASDASEPDRFRKAAQWALDALNATQVGGN
jgi:hypothetical protein